MLLGDEHVNFRLAVGVRVEHAAIDRAAHRQDKDRLALPVNCDPPLADAVLAQHGAVGFRVAKRHVPRRAVQPTEQRLVLALSGLSDEADLAGFIVQRIERAVAADVQPILG